MNIFILTKCDNGCCYCDEIIGVYASLEEAKLSGELYIKKKKGTAIIEEWIVGNTSFTTSWFRSHTNGQENWDVLQSWGGP